MKFRVDLDTFLSNREVPAKYIILSSAFVFFFLCALVTSFATDNYAAIMMGIVSGIIAWSLSREIKQLRDKEQLLHFQKGISANGFDATMFAFFIFSPSGKCIFLNNVAQHLFPGFNVRTIEDLSICFGKYPKIVDAINDLKIATNNMKQSHIDVPFTLNKGNTVLWRISVSPIPNYTGYSGWSIIDLTPSNSRIESFDTDPCFLLDVINRSDVGFFTIDINEKMNGRF